MALRFWKTSISAFTYHFSSLCMLYLLSRTLLALSTDVKFNYLHLPRTVEKYNSELERVLVFEFSLIQKRKIEGATSEESENRCTSVH